MLYYNNTDKEFSINIANRKYITCISRYSCGLGEINLIPYEKRNYSDLSKKLCLICLFV